ncbi:unnamed protein product [Haemonchus placei]|uniref:Uncharacterized protein n=1 Tax=Haemonchus placei TaxID=6290 RepID=A0A3P7VNI4_HAEPC|nr:unnamed protein product [Haemonchus placei]
MDESNNSLRKSSYCWGPNRRLCIVIRIAILH